MLATHTHGQRNINTYTRSVPHGKGTQMKLGLDAIRMNTPQGGSGSGQTGYGRYLSYFILKDGESKVVRFLTDMNDVVGVRFHEFVKDRNGKFQNFVYAPDYHGEGEDWVAKYGGMTIDYNTKQPVESVPRARVVGLVVEREEVGDAKNRASTKTQDLITTFTGRDGVTYNSRNFLVVKQHPRFWQQWETYYNEYGTLCDRDYKITRNGTGRDMIYSIIPRSPDPNWNNDGSSLEQLRARYGYGTGKDIDGNDLTPESEDRFLYCRETLIDWLDHQATEERVREALVGGEEIASAAPEIKTERATEAAAPPATDTDVSSLRARLERHR